MLLADVHNRDRRTFLSCTTCTSTAVGITFNIIGQTIVDDMGEIVNIKSTGCHISSHK